MGLNNWDLAYGHGDTSVQQHFYTTHGIPPIRVSISRDGFHSNVEVHAMNDDLDWAIILATAATTGGPTVAVDEDELVAAAVDAAEKILARHPKYAEPIED